MTMVNYVENSLIKIAKCESTKEKKFVKTKRNLSRIRVSKIIDDLYRSLNTLKKHII